MHETTHSLMQAVDEYQKSKINLVTTTTLAVQQVVAPVPPSFDWIFLFQCIGAFYVALQIIHILYRFFNFSKEVLKDAKRRKQQPKDAKANASIRKQEKGHP